MHSQIKVSLQIIQNLPENWEFTLTLGFLHRKRKISYLTVRTRGRGGIYIQTYIYVISEKTLTATKSLKYGVIGLYTQKKTLIILTCQPA